jgi:DNA polymerase V
MTWFPWRDSRLVSTVATNHVTVFFHTSEHDRDQSQRSFSTVVSLPEATNDTLAVVKAATQGVRKTWRDGFRYFKAGVVTADLTSMAASQRAMPGLGQLDRKMGAAPM